MSDLEKRLLEFMKADAAIWERRTAMVDHAMGTEPDKITITKRQWDARRMIREKIARIAVSNPKVRKIHGTMMLNEKPDKLCSPTMTCAWSGEPFGAIKRGNRPVALYCSKNCSHSAWRIRRTLANG